MGKNDDFFSGNAGRNRNRAKPSIGFRLVDEDTPLSEIPKNAEVAPFKFAVVRFQAENRLLITSEGLKEACDHPEIESVFGDDEGLKHMLNMMSHIAIGISAKGLKLVDGENLNKAEYDFSINGSRMQLRSVLMNGKFRIIVGSPNGNIEKGTLGPMLDFQYDPEEPKEEPEVVADMDKFIEATQEAHRMAMEFTGTYRPKRCVEILSAMINSQSVVIKKLLNYIGNENPEEFKKIFASDKDKEILKDVQGLYAETNRNMDKLKGENDVPSDSGDQPVDAADDTAGGGGTHEG